MFRLTESHSVNPKFGQYGSYEHHYSVYFYSNCVPYLHVKLLIESYVGIENNRVASFTRIVFTQRDIKLVLFYFAQFVLKCPSLVHNFYPKPSFRDDADQDADERSRGHVEKKVGPHLERTQ